MDLNPRSSPNVPFFEVQKASNFGDVSDVYTGYDLNVNARLPRGGSASGGVSIGHEVTDICGVAGQASVTYAGVAGVLASSCGHARPRMIGTRARSTATSSRRFRPTSRAFVTYPLPWWGLNASATLQNRPGRRSRRTTR